jgi:hypothetical protein
MTEEISVKDINEEGMQLIERSYRQRLVRLRHREIASVRTRSSDAVLVKDTSPDGLQQWFADFSVLIQTGRSTCQPLALVYSDIYGPITPTSIGNTGEVMSSPSPTTSLAIVRHIPFTINLRKQSCKSSKPGNLSSRIKPASLSSAFVPTKTKSTLDIKSVTFKLKALHTNQTLGIVHNPTTSQNDYIGHGMPYATHIITNAICILGRSPCNSKIHSQLTSYKIITLLHITSRSMVR